MKMTEEEKRANRRASKKRYYEKNKQKQALYHRSWREKDPKKYAEAERRKHLKRKYGLTLEQYDAMLLSQGSRCAICSTAVPGGTGCFPVDHCHTTGAIRGLLCNECNIGLGKFKDNTDTLLKAVDYLKAAHAPSPPT